MILTFCTDFKDSLATHLYQSKQLQMSLDRPKKQQDEPLLSWSRGAQVSPQLSWHPPHPPVGPPVPSPIAPSSVQPRGNKTSKLSCCWRLPPTPSCSTAPKSSRSCLLLLLLDGGDCRVGVTLFIKWIKNERENSLNIKDSF